MLRATEKNQRKILTFTVIILIPKSCISCFSWIYFHKKHFISFNVDHKIDSEVSFVIPFVIKIVAEPLSDRINFASYFLVNFLILEVILPKLISAKATQVWSQLLVANHLSVHRTQNSAELPCDCADPKRFQSSKRHYFFGVTVFELI
jgi:hypothetical protein